MLSHPLRLIHPHGFYSTTFNLDRADDDAFLCGGPRSPRSTSVLSPVSRLRSIQLCGVHERRPAGRW